MDSPGKSKKPLVPPRPSKLNPPCALNLSPVGLTTPPLLSPGPCSPRTPTSTSSPPVNRLRQRFGRIFGGGGSASQPPSPTTPERTSSPAVASHSFEELNSPTGKKTRSALGSVSSEPGKPSSPQSPTPNRRANWRSKSDSAKVLKSMRHGLISPASTSQSLKYKLTAGSQQERGMIAAKKMVAPAVRTCTKPATKLFAPIHGESGSWHRIFRLPQLLLSTVC